MRPLPTLRQLLLLLAFACVLPMAALAIGLVAWQYDRGRQQTERDAVGTARALMAAVDDRFENVQRALEGLAQSPALAAGDFARLREEALVVQRAEQVVGVLLLEPSGRQLLNTLAAPEQPLLTDSWPQMLEAVRRRRPAAIDLFRAPLAGRLLVGAAVPMPQDGAPRYSLNANVDPATLREVLLRQKLPQGWIAAVLDRSGAIVARTHDHERFLGTPARAALVARIAEVAEAAVESTTVDGVPVVTAFSRSPQSGWAVAIGMPQADLQAPIRRTAMLLLLGTLAVLLLSLWLAWRLAHALGASVEALGGAARAIGHTPDLDLPEPVFQEAHQLAQALRYASATVEDARSSRLHVFGGSLSEFPRPEQFEAAASVTVSDEPGGRRYTILLHEPGRMQRPPPESD